MFGTLQAGNNTQHLWMITAGLGVGLLGVTGLVVFLMRKSFRSRREEQKEEFKTSGPGTENASASMVSSMHGVIDHPLGQARGSESRQRVESALAERTD